MGRPPKPRTILLPPPVDGARWVSLGGDRFALVDAVDYDWLVQKGSWYFAKPSYAARGISIKFDGRWISRHIYMHHEVLGLGPDARVDHKDGNGLNNRRSNLRPALQQQNMMNRPALSNNRSGYKGVTAQRGKWRAAIALDGKQAFLGYFPTPEAAAHAYDQAAVVMFGEFARFNFERPATIDPDIEARSRAAMTRVKRSDGLSSVNTSGYRGVSFRADRGGRWMAMIHHQGKAQYIGLFGTKEAAARAYNEAARRLHGADARLNEVRTI